MLDHHTRADSAREPSSSAELPELVSQFHATATELAFEPAYVLLRQKKAFQKGWPELRPTLDEVLAHLAASDENAVGVQPGSFGTIVLDCDEGEGPEVAAAAIRHFLGDVVMCVTPSTSGRPERGHVWIRCDQPVEVGNWKFRIEDPIDGEVKGDIRSWGGQVRLTAAGIPTIIEALRRVGPAAEPKDIARFRSSSARELDAGFDRASGREPDWDVADRADWQWLEPRLIEDPADRSAQLFAVAGRMKRLGFSFDSSLAALEPYTSSWTKDGHDDGKYAGQSLEVALARAWARLPPPRNPSDDFGDDAADNQPDGADDAAWKKALQDWVWVADPMRFIRRTDLKQFNKDQWNSLHSDLDPEGSLLTKVWKGKTPVQRFESLAYRPSAPEILGRSTYNIWRPSRIEPVEGDVSPIFEHLEYLLPNSEERQHLLDFMHLVCVRPEVKIHFALLLQGAQGTGKTLLGTLLKRIIGDGNVVEPSPDELKERWSKWQEGASLAIVEELMMNGRLELANKLKPVITNDTLRIEDKGAPLYSIPNHLNMLCFTNHKNAVRLEEGDRRWLILFSPAEPRDDGYYRRLFRFIEGEGPPRWLAYLHAHKLALNPKGRAPETAAKSVMREASLTDVEATVREWMASGTGPMASDLFRFEDAWSKLERLGRPHKSALKLALEAAGCVQHPRQKNVGLPQVVLWSCRNHEKWSKAGPAKRTRAWMDTQGFASLEDFQEMN